METLGYLSYQLLGRLRAWQMLAKESMKDRSAGVASLQWIL
jgi:hypothetical protein